MCILRYSYEVPIVVARFQCNLQHLHWFSKNIHMSNIIKIHPVEAELFVSDGRTWRSFSPWRPLTNKQRNIQLRINVSAYDSECLFLTYIRTVIYHLRFSVLCRSVHLDTFVEVRFSKLWAVVVSQQYCVCVCIVLWCKVPSCEWGWQGMESIPFWRLSVFIQYVTRLPVLWQLLTAFAFVTIAVTVQAASGGNTNKLCWHRTSYGLSVFSWLLEITFGVSSFK
jgi:hypothetical protein